MKKEIEEFPGKEKLDALKEEIEATKKKRVGSRKKKKGEVQDPEIWEGLLLHEVVCDIGIISSMMVANRWSLRAAAENLEKISKDIYYKLQQYE